MQRNIKENTCRVCLTEQKVLISLFDEVEEFQLKLCELLENCGDIKVDFEDIYSKLICGECTHELLVAAKFREKCKNTKEILSQFVPAEECESNASNEDVIQDPSSPIIHEVCTIEESDDLQLKHEIEDVELDSDQFDTADCEIQSKVSCIEEIVPTDMFEQVEFLETGEGAAQFIIVGNELSREEEPDVNTDNMINMSQEDTGERDDVENPQQKKKKTINSRLTKPVVINYNCGVCGAGFNKVKNLRRHLNTHSPMEIYSCPLCFYPFVDLETYQLHQNDPEKCASIVNVKDIEEVTETAEQPPDNVKKKPDFEQLQFSNSAIKKNHKCQFCEKGFVSKSSLAAHLRIHTGDRPFHCTLCSKKFTTQGGLVLHTRRHTGLRPFVCNICNKRFVESSNLKVHMRIHTGEKPHKCTICGRSFARVFLLQLHQRTHTGERPYSCPFCNKAFAQQGDLSSHKRIHTGERPHACQYCGKGFIKSSALTQHLKKHAKLDSVRFNCGIKEEDFSVLIIDDENLRTCDNEEDSRDIDEPMDVIVESPSEEVTSC